MTPWPTPKPSTSSWPNWGIATDTKLPVASERASGFPDAPFLRLGRYLHGLRRKAGAFFVRHTHRQLPTEGFSCKPNHKQGPTLEEKPRQAPFFKTKSPGFLQGSKSQSGRGAVRRCLPLTPIRLLRVRALPRSGHQSCRYAGRPSHEPSS